MEKELIHQLQAQIGKISWKTVCGKGGYGEAPKNTSFYSNEVTCNTCLDRMRLPLIIDKDSIEA